MKWIKFLLAGLFTFTTVYQLYSTAIHYGDLSYSYREESSDKATSAERRRDARLYADVYFAVSVALNSTLMFAMAIVYSVMVVFNVLHGSSEVRIRALEEEVKQMRSLVSGHRQ